MTTGRGKKQGRESSTPRIPQHPGELWGRKGGKMGREKWKGLRNWEWREVTEGEGEVGMGGEMVREKGRERKKRE